MEACNLIDRLHRLIRGGAADDLDPWIDAAAKSLVGGFAMGGAATWRKSTDPGRTNGDARLSRCAQVRISQHPRRGPPRRIDPDLHKWHHLIENFFGKLKEFKGIALRACKADASLAAATILNSK